VTLSTIGGGQGASVSFAFASAMCVANSVRVGEPIYQVFMKGGDVKQ